MTNSEPTPHNQVKQKNGSSTKEGQRWLVLFVEIVENHEQSREERYLRSVIQDPNRHWRGTWVGDHSFQWLVVNAGQAMWYSFFSKVISRFFDDHIRLFQGPWETKEQKEAFGDAQMPLALPTLGRV
jgi:hypothetical protein